MRTAEALSQPKKFSQSLTLHTIVFAAGVLAMVVAGWYLIEGMLHFAGDAASKRIFIAAGILFQITEAICFVAAAALSTKNFIWRVGLFTLGCVLFLFSITVMTLAQKATLQAGENQAQASDAQIQALQAQVDSLNDVIAGYRLNAEKQSKSIYADSRELGQDSLNRAVELEQQKLVLSKQLYELKNQRKQTSSDFFKQLEKITGLPSLQMEFYFLVTRSVLMELCGIVLMAFAAHLRIPHPANKEHKAEGPFKIFTQPVLNTALALQPEIPELTIDKEANPEPDAQQKRTPPNKNITKPGTRANYINALQIAEPNPHWADDYIKALRKQQDVQTKDEVVKERKPTKTASKRVDYEKLTNLVISLYEQGKLKSLARDTIRTALNEHFNQRIGSGTASTIQKRVKLWLENKDKIDKV
jgi:predicted HTH domain antitoxin